MVLRLGKGHSDNQAFMAQELPEPSLPPSSGCAGDASHGRQLKAVSKGHHKERARLRQTAWVVVVVVVLTGERRTCLCRYDRTSRHLIQVAVRLGASSRRPRHPFSALMAGVNPGPVPVHRAPQAHPSSQLTSLHDHRDV